MQTPLSFRLIFLLSISFQSLFPQTPSNSFSVPSVAEAGARAVIHGPFDGDASNTRIFISEIWVTAEGETAGSCTFLVPPAMEGKQKIALEEAGSHFETEIVILRITPTLEQSNLTKGETTQLRLNVKGTADLDSAVNLDVTNASPRQISIGEGNNVNVVIAPGSDTTIVIKIKAKQTGNFDIVYELEEDIPTMQFAEAPANEKAKADSTSKEDCGSIKGKVINKTGHEFTGIVVYVTGTCEFCEPKPPYTSPTVTFGDDGAQPAFIVLPKDSSFTMKNGYDKDIDELPRIVPSPVDDGRSKDIKALGKGESTMVTPTKSGGYLIDSDIHKRTDGYMFVTPNSCYSVTDTAGNYFIGKLPPGTYHLKVFTHPKRSEFPEADVTVKANEVTIRDFVLEEK